MFGTPGAAQYVFDLRPCRWPSRARFFGCLALRCPHRKTCGVCYCQSKLVSVEPGSNPFSSKLLRALWRVPIPAWLALEIAVCNLFWRNNKCRCSNTGLANTGNRRLQFSLAKKSAFAPVLAWLTLGIAVCNLFWRNTNCLCSNTGLAKTGNRRLQFILAK